MQTKRFHDFTYSFAAVSQVSPTTEDQLMTKRIQKGWGREPKRGFFGPCVLMISPFDAEMKNETCFGVTSSRDVKKFGDSLGYIGYFENFQHVD